MANFHRAITDSIRPPEVRLSDRAWLPLISGLAVLLGVMLFLNGATPVVFAWMIFLAGIAAILYRPHYGVYLIIFFTLAGDSYLTWQYPFAKNFSSKESIFYLNSALIFSPLELYIVLTFVSWALHGLFTRQMGFRRGPLLYPMLAFMVFVVTGFIYGYTRHGDTKIALWEMRPILYMFAMFLLTNSLFKNPRNILYLMWLVCIAMFIEGVIGSQAFFFDLKGDLSGVNQITEHSAAIQMNSVFVFAIGLWMYRTSLKKRMLLLMALPPIFITYLATQRRAAFLTLIFALAVIAVLIYLQHRRLFWLIVPPAALLAIVYVAVFWNAHGVLGLPVEAIKSVVAPSSASLRNQSSNAYRVSENMNLAFTLHQRPLTGVGFGQKFYVIVPMPDISFFTWWQYLPHNSIIWIWLKTGIFGFVAMLILISTALQQGAQYLRRAPNTEIAAALLAMTLYLLMHFIYAYADISWDSRSMVYVGAVMGIINSLPAIMANTEPAQKKRWPWQPQPQPQPGLLPLPGDPAVPTSQPPAIP